MTKYEHTQIGHTIVWVALGAAVFVAITGIFAQAGPGTSLIIEVILLICALLFCKLTIRIHGATLRWLRDGRKFALGTDDMQELVDAIRRFTAAT